MPPSFKTIDSPTAPTADHEMDNAYQDDFTEERMASPEQREDTAHDLKMDPTTPEDSAVAPMPKAGGEPDFDDDVAASEDEEDDDEEEDTTA